MQHRPGLEVDGLSSGYGPVPVLRGVSIQIGTGEMVAILGPNGAGKSTLMQTLVGLVRPTGGRIRLDGSDITGVSPERIVARGMTLVPEGRRIFGRLSVSENLRMGGYTRRDTAAMGREIAEHFQRFPILGERRAQTAGTLSGGEQQQLAICRALMSQPSTLLVDEPSLGLAPVIADQVFDLLATLRAERGLTVVLVEQNVTEALQICDRAYLLEHGVVAASGAAAQIAEAAADLERCYLSGDAS